MTERAASKVIFLSVALAATCFLLATAVAADLPELVLQTGHNKLVRAVVISPDNKWVATGSFDSTIRIWSVQTGRELRSLTGHQGGVTALACSFDGDTLASAGNDDTIRIWDVEHGIEKVVLKDKKDITLMQFGTDARRLSYADAQGHVIIVDVVSGTVVADLAGPAGEIKALAVSRDGGTIASGSRQGVISIWNTVTGKLSKTFKGHPAKITALKIDDADSLLASGDESGTIRLWDPQTGRRLAILNTGNAVTAIAFSSPQRLTAVDDQGEIKTWKLVAKDWTREPDHAMSKREIEAVAFSPDASLLAVGSGDGTASILDAASGRVLQELENHTVGFYGVDLSKDGHWLAGAGFDNTVKVWDLRMGNGMQPLAGHTGRVTGVAFAGKDRVVSASVDHTLRVWDLLTRRCLAVLSGHTNSISGVAVGSKGTLVVSAGADGKIGIWNIEGKQTPRFLIGHSGEVVSVAISPDEQTIASAGVDGTVRLWDPTSGKQLAVVDAKAGEIDAVAFSADGSLIAAAGIDGTIRVWQINDRSLVRSFAGHSGKINSVAFSPDGLSITSAAQDGSVHIWNVGAGREMMSIDAHAGPVFGVTYSSDGRFIGSASDDGSIALWNAQNGSRTATLMSLRGSTDWVAVTPGGFFDGSPAGWAQLAWRFDNDTFNSKPVEVFFSEYYLPGLLSDIVGGRELPKVSSITNRDRRQPEVKMSLTADPAAVRTVRVSIELTSAPAGARDLRLFRNGSLVKVWPGDVLTGKTSARLEAKVPIVAGHNRLTAYAFNSDNVKSSDAVLTVDGPSSLARKGNLYLLAVGINEYDNREFNLRYAVADADDFASEMQSQQATINQYGNIEVIPLKNADAKKETILRTLRGLSAKTQPEDSVVIYYAGHGIADRNRFYLVPHDLGYSGRRSDLNEKGLQEIFASSISDEELEAAVREIDAGHLLLVIDACNSGQVLETEEKRRGPMNSKGLAQLAYEKGMYILTAAQSYQAAQEAAKLGHGFLTFALVEEGLKTGAADDDPRDGDVTLREWLDFAAARVPQLQQEDLTARELTRDKSAGKPAIDERSIQRPRVFYRRDPDISPFIVSRR